MDVVNFGEISPNTDKLSAFVTALNGKEGQTSYLVTVPPGPTLSDSIRDSPIVKVWFSILQYRVISLRCRILLSFYSEMPHILDFILIVSKRA